MRSIKFPEMFNSNSTNTIKDLDATKQNTILLLKSEKGEFVSDPYFGIRLKKYLFEQNSYILTDIILDEIYTQVALFLPQLTIRRQDINIIRDRAKLICSFKATNRLDFTTDMYSLVLYDENE